MAVKDRDKIDYVSMSEMCSLYGSDFNYFFTWCIEVCYVHTSMCTYIYVTDR